VESLLNTKATLLQALFAGPGYGLELIERVAKGTGGRVRLGQGSVYPALRELEARRLVRSWTGPTNGRRAGRPRLYYELTVAGVATATALRETVAAFVAASGPTPASGDARAMESRLQRSLDLSALGRILRRVSRPAGRP